MKIMVAIDGSEQSMQALQYVDKLPFADKKLHLIHVREPLLRLSFKSISQDSQKKITGINHEVTLEAEKTMKRALALVEATQVEKYEIVEGQPVVTLLEATRSVKPDLLVMGSRGLNPVKSFFLGSVSDALFRNAECSMLIYRGDSPAVDAHVQRIVLGYDESDVARSALAQVSRWNFQKPCAVDLVFCYQMTHYYGMSYSVADLEAWPNHKAAVEKNMQEALDGIENKNAHVTFNKRVIGDVFDVADQLDKQVKESNAQLMVVGQSVKSFLGRLLVGSVSAKLANQASKPIMVVR